jgi:prefoldin subunit 5
MKNSKSRKRGVTAPYIKKTKLQLQEELSEVQDALKKQENEISECRGKLQQAQDELAHLKELQAKLNEAEGAERRLQVSETHEHQLAKRISDLEKVIEFLKSKFKAAEQWDKAISKHILSQKASYRIDLYRYQGQYQGKIEHILTKDKKAFTGLDGIAIIEFMSRHLPQVEKTEPHVAQPISPGAKVEDFVDSEHISGPLQRLSDLRVVPVGADTPITTLSQNQIFEVHVNVDLTDVIIPEDESIEKTLTIYAKRLGGPHEIIGEARSIPISSGKRPFKMIGKSLPVGAYRLEAFLTFNRPPGVSASLPHSFFLKGSILNVH